MAHISNLAGIRSSTVKDVTDLYVVKGGVFSPVQSAWLVKNGVLVKMFERRGTAVTMTFISPSPASGESMVAGSTKTWKVKVPIVDGLVPTGTVVFTGPGGGVSATIDAAGEASASFTHRPGQRTVTAMLSSTNGYTANDISRTVSIQAAESDMYFVSPNYDQAYFGENNVTFRVRMTSAWGVLPVGTVKFTSANGEVKSGNIWHDQEGGVWYAYAEQTLWMPYWKRTVTAELVATNDFWAYSESWRVRVLALGTARQTQTLWYESANYYIGGSGGPVAVGTNLYMGDLGGDSYRTFTKQNYPAKPDPGAYCVGVYAYFSTLIASSLIRVGFHILWPLPGTGNLGQAGVLSDRVGVGPVGAGARYSADLSLHAYQAMNDGTFRGLVFGGASGQTPYGRVWNDPAVDVIWEWQYWYDT